MSEVTADALLAALRRHIAWQERQGPLSQDQYDIWAGGLGRRSKRRFYEGRVGGRLACAPLVAVDALVPRARRWLRRPTRFPIADAHYAMGHLALRGALDGPARLRVADEALTALRASRSPAEADLCWGYPFDWVTVWGTWPAGTPLVTTTPYVYEAFEAHVAATGDDASREAMRSIARWAYERLTQAEVAAGVAATSYSPRDDRRVVNASAYRGFLLLSAGRTFANEEWRTAARENLSFVLHSQRPDGSWLYAVDGKDAFIDNFHTCFVIKNLVKAFALDGDDDLLAAARRGYAFYKRALLDSYGLPRPFALTQRANLVRRELYDFAEGVNLALLMRDHDDTAEFILEELLRALLSAWQLPDGHFVTRRTLLGRNAVPYHRWAQSQVFRALALVAAERG
jgi:hypothetical protein